MGLKTVRTAAILAAGMVLAVGGLHSFAQTKSKPPEQNYGAAVWNKYHFQPAIDKATDKQCLSCHRDVLERKPRKKSPAGVDASKAIAWYQALSTYAGEQENFHWRHISSPFAKSVMNLSCTFCHQGHDPREEAPGSSATAPPQSKPAGFTLRKTVDTSNTCLRCHGSFPKKIMQLDDPWPVVRPTLESEDAKNGCLSCHQETFRTNRHNVTYLNGAKIEELAKNDSDSCYGCHGGRAWYRNSYPYPRTPWPDMDEEVPDWAKNRPTQSEERFRIKAKVEPQKPAAKSNIKKQ